MDMSGMSGMDSGSHSSSSGSMMSMSQMQMTFFSGQNTPLYSTAWTPSGTGTYAATCIFLIILCAISRFLWAWKLILDRRLQYRSSAAARRIVGYTDDEDESSDAQASKESSSPRRRRLKEQFQFGRNWGPVPWRLYIDLPRAIVFTILLGVGYLLMLAVMTMNVGYFLSVLAGGFLGELMFGRYASGLSLGDHVC